MVVKIFQSSLISREVKQGGKKKNSNNDRVKLIAIYFLDVVRIT